MTVGSEQHLEDWNEHPKVEKTMCTHQTGSPKHTDGNRFFSNGALPSGTPCAQQVQVAVLDEQRIRLLLPRQQVHAAEELDKVRAAAAALHVDALEGGVAVRQAHWQADGGVQELLVAKKPHAPAAIAGHECVRAVEQHRRLGAAHERRVADREECSQRGFMSKNCRRWLQNAVKVWACFCHCIPRQALGQCAMVWA